MNYPLVFFCLLFASSKMYGQTPANNPVNCQTGITIQVFSSGATYLILGNAAPFIFVPSSGQVTNYTLTKVGTSTPFAQQSVVNMVGNTNNTFNFQLPASVTTADLISVQMSITNTNGDVCSVQDVFHWVNIGSTAFPVFAWRNVNFPGNFGTYSNVLSTTDFDSNPFSFYPNPTNDVVNFSFKNAIENITLYNVLGQEVFSKNIDSKEFSIDISNLSIGTYVAKLNTDGRSQSVKLIKI